VRWLDETISTEFLRMADDGQEHLTTTEARAGQTPNMARWVLIFGTGLVIIAFAIILIVGS
jgi:hypothetical protein